MKLLYILPNRSLTSDAAMLGSTKDIFCRIEYFDERRIDFDVFAHHRNQISLSDDLSFYTLGDYSHVLIEQTYGFGDFAYIRERWPRAKLIVRSHQCEIPHRRDYVTALHEIKANAGAFREAKRALEIYRDRDTGVAHFADSILSIEPADSEAYWRSLGFRGRFFFAPYFLPSAYLPEFSPVRPRRNQVVCVGSSDPGPLTASIILGFHKAVSALRRQDLIDWRFLVTGSLPKGVTEEIPRIQYLGDVGSLFGLLSETRAVAVTSRLGRGFKTKILDAITCGAWVIVPPALYKRLPDSVRPFCIVLKDQKYALAGAIEELQQRAWPRQDLNNTLRLQAYVALESALMQ